jgi:SAM-dependent methyltransferase
VIHSTTTAEFFDAKYRENRDPWNFAHSEYERSRYDAILAALSTQTYQRAFEPGCSVGELTARLAARCIQVEAMDISPTAVASARLRCQEFSNVEIHVGALPQTMPDGTFDLIVFSEIGYYFEETSLQESAKMFVSRISPSGTFLAAHWLGTSQDHILSGDRVHEILVDVDGLQMEHSERHTHFRVDRWRRI